MTEYMDPNRPKLITPQPSANPPSEEHYPGKSFEGDAKSYEEGQGNYSDRKDRSVPLPR